MCQNEKIDNLPFDAPTSKVRKADAVVMIDGVMVVRLANGRFITSARDFHKWAYTISHDLHFREPIVRGLAAIGFISSAEADEHMAEHRRAKERRDHKFAEEMVLLYGSKLGIADAIAQAIEARSGQTEGLDPQGESAVAEGHAPDLPADLPSQGDK
jgi:hypothetical protein